jgi:hypothetical protein
MKHLGIIAIILLLIMILPIVESCASADVVNEAGTSSESLKETENSELDNGYYDELPDNLNFDGRNIRRRHMSYIQ